MEREVVATGPGSCSTTGAVVLSEAQESDPGGRYSCVDVNDHQGSPGFIVYRERMATTYLLQVEHTRGAGSGDVVVGDPAVTTHHVRYGLDTEPLAADFAAVEARMDAFWDSIKAQRFPAAVVAGYRWYREPRTAGTTNPAVRSTVKNIAGTATSGSALPAQVAATVTEVTDVRRRWGRFYIPSLTTNALDGNGLLKNVVADIFANAAQTLYAQTLTNWLWVVHGAQEPRSLIIREVRVDNIFDIQRRRRPDKASHRAVRAVTQAP